MNSRGQILTDQQEIGNLFSSFHGQVFSSFNPTDINACIQDLTPIVSDDINGAPLQDFTTTEVQKVIFQINPYGAPGPDGFSAVFHQKNRSIVGREVTSFALEVLNNNGSLENVYDTFVTLIPKV